MPVLAAADLKKHLSKESLWIVIDDKVYDVTTWKDKHPGGDAVLLDNAGKDVTELFENFGHGEDARQIRDGLFVGTFEDETKTKGTTSNLEVVDARFSSGMTFYALILIGAGVLAYLSLFFSGHLA